MASAYDPSSPRSAGAPPGRTAAHLATAPSAPTASSAPTGPAATANADALTAQALADAKDADATAAQATNAADNAQSLFSAAQQTAAHVLNLASPQQARIPTATDPTTAEGPLQTAAQQIGAALARTRAGATAASTAAAATARIADQDAAAADAGARTTADAKRARDALATAQDAQNQMSALLSRVQTAIGEWQSVHAAPPGSLGIQGQAAAASRSIAGCEILSAPPASPASRAGLVGRSQRTDPVGDVIVSVTDTTDQGTNWPVPNCAALSAAMAQTRGGDHLTISYQHREVVWYLLSGRWVPQTASVTLPKTGGA